MANDENSPQYSGTGRKGFIFSEQERQRQYQRYLDYYNEYHRSYGDNMTSNYSYKTFVSKRLEDLSQSRRLDEKPSTLKQMAAEQIETSYAQARSTVHNARMNIKNIIRKQKQIDSGKRKRRLSKLEETILETTTDKKTIEKIDRKTGKKILVDVYEIKDLSAKEFRAGGGVLNELNDKLKIMELHGEIKDYSDEVFGSP